MALFFVNRCSFNSQGVTCSKTFKSLGELIYHIEELHIDNDAQKFEQKEMSQQMCLPLSYVLRFVTEAAKLQNDRGGMVRASTPPLCPVIATTPTSSLVTTPQSPIAMGGSGEVKRKNAIKHHTYSLSSSNRSGTPTASEAMSDEEPMLTESEDSNESWTTEEFSSEFIMKYGVKNCAVNGLANTEKPYMCPVPGCKKRYKNVNGIKYHSKNGHKKDGKVRKGYKCHCGKSYKTAQRLKHHAILASHSGVNVAAVASSIAASKTPPHANNSNVGLVAIKTKPVSATKLVKQIAPGTVQSPPSTPKLENFGVLTPATSPRIQTTPDPTAAFVLSMMTTGNKKNGFVTPSTSTNTDGSETDNEAGSKTAFDET